MEASTPWSRPSTRLCASTRGGVEPDYQQLSSIDLGCHLAAYFGRRVGAGQRCCQPANADPLAGQEAPALNRKNFQDFAK